jgi:hypothetical protein
MRALFYATAVLLITFIVGVGCSHSGSGDFGTFVVPQVTEYGGHTKIVGVIPNLFARWTVKQDADGFTAHISQVPFSAVDGFMRKVYGPPNISTEMNHDGEPQRVWAAANIGVAIQLIGHTNDTEIICARSGP